MALGAGVEAVRSDRGMHAPRHIQLWQISNDSWRSRCWWLLRAVTPDTLRDVFRGNSPPLVALRAREIGGLKREPRMGSDRSDPPAGLPNPLHPPYPLPPCPP